MWYPSGSRPCNGRGCRVIEADDSTAETEHCSLERHLSTGRRLIEQGSHDLALASLGIFCGIIADIGAELYNVQPPVAAMSFKSIRLVKREFTIINHSFQTAIAINLHYFYNSTPAKNNQLFFVNNALHR